MDSNFLQWPEGYAEGHVPGAVNIPRWELFQPGNLSRLPVDRPIVICCYLGFTSSQVTAILNMMGYDAQVALHGLSAWTLDPEIAHFRINAPQNWRDYPIEGTVLTAVGQVPPLAERESFTCAQEYIVETDDSLSGLAAKFFGDRLLFPEIVTATNQMYTIDNTFSKIINPNVIETGWKLCIPSLENMKSEN